MGPKSAVGASFAKALETRAPIVPNQKAIDQELIDSRNGNNNPNSPDPHGRQLVGEVEVVGKRYPNHIGEVEIKGTAPSYDSMVEKNGNIDVPFEKRKAMETIHKQEQEAKSPEQVAQESAAQLDIRRKVALKRKSMGWDYDKALIDPSEGEQRQSLLKSFADKL